MPSVNASLRAGTRGWLSALVLAGVGLWSSLSLLDVVRWQGRVVRVGMLAPWWLLASLVVLLGAAALVAARTGRNPDVARPLCALGLLFLPYLPWLPDRLPVLRALAGPTRYLLWPVVFWLVAAPGLESLLARWLRSSPGRWISWAVAQLAGRFRVGRGPLVVFLASALVFGTVAWRLVGSPLFPGGDEPHYLVITQSLLRDGDLKIENNHQRGDYREYFSQPLKPDYLAVGKDGQIYSVHPVGMPVLAIPAFALGGYHGVVAMVVLMAALAATLMWRWADAFTGSPPAATFAWAAVSFTAPFLFNSFSVYPEIPGALAVMVAFTCWPEATGTGPLLLRGAAIGALPWLSTKYAPMAGALTVVAMLRLHGNLRAMATCLAPIAVAFAGWFAFFFWIWGTVSPSAPYGSSQPMTLEYFMHGVPGLLFDQEYGILVAAPVLIVALVGLASMLRARGVEARRAVELKIVFAVLLVTVGAFRLWWGGEASVGRPLASGVLLLALPIAWVYKGSEGRPVARAALHLLLATSLVMAWVMAEPGGSLLHQDRDGTSVLVDWLSPSWPLSSALPSFIAGPLAGAVARTIAWLVGGAVTWWAVSFLRLRQSGAAALATLTLGFIGVVAVASLITHPAELPVEFAPEARSRMPLLDRFDRSRRPTTVFYDPLSRISAEDALSRVTLVARPGMRTAFQTVPLLWNARFALPAGRYRVLLKRRGPAPPDRTLALLVGRTGSLERWTVSGPAWEQRFVLPVDADLVGFGSPDNITDGELQLNPEVVVDEGRRLPRPPVADTVRQGGPDGVTAFFHDGNALREPGGYWTRGGARTAVTYAIAAAAPATAIPLAVRCGPVPNEVTLSMPGWSERFALEANASRTLSIPTIARPDLDVRVAPLDIAVRNGFVPASVDPSSTDRRYLGCWIELPR